MPRRLVTSPGRWGGGEGGRGSSPRGTTNAPGTGCALRLKRKKTDAGLKRSNSSLLHREERQRARRAAEPSGGRSHGRVRRWDRPPAGGRARPAQGPGAESPSDRSRSGWLSGQAYTSLCRRHPPTLAGPGHATAPQRPARRGQPSAEAARSPAPSPRRTRLRSRTSRPRAQAWPSASAPVLSARASQRPARTPPREPAGLSPLPATGPALRSLKYVTRPHVCQTAPPETVSPQRSRFRFVVDLTFIILERSPASANSKTMFSSLSSMNDA